MGHASGKFAIAISDRSGLQFPYTEMVKEWNGAWVHTSEYEPKAPQLMPHEHSPDPQSLKRPRPARGAFPVPNLLPENPLMSYRKFVFSSKRLKSIEKLREKIIH